MADGSSRVSELVEVVGGLGRADVALGAGEVVRLVHHREGAYFRRGVRLRERAREEPLHRAVGALRLVLVHEELLELRRGGSRVLVTRLQSPDVVLGGQVPGGLLVEEIVFRLLVYGRNIRGALRVLVPPANLAQLVESR